MPLNGRILMTITFFFSLALSLSKNSSLLFSTHCPLIPCQESGIALRLQPITWCQCFQRLPVTINTFAGRRMLLAASSSSSLPPAKVLVGAAMPPVHGRPSPGGSLRVQGGDDSQRALALPLFKALWPTLDIPYLLSSSHQPRDGRLSWSLGDSQPGRDPSEHLLFLTVRVAHTQAGAPDPAAVRAPPGRPRPRRNESQSLWLPRIRFQQETKRMKKSLREKNDRFPHDGPFDRKKRTVTKPRRCQNSTDRAESPEKRSAAGAGTRIRSAFNTETSPVTGPAGRCGAQPPPPLPHPGGWRVGAAGVLRALAPGEDSAFQKEPQMRAGPSAVRQVETPAARGWGSGKVVRAEGRRRRLGKGFHKVQ